MRAKTIFIIIITAIITIFLTINTDAVKFNFIFTETSISKLVVVGVCTFVGFVLGYWVGRPKVTIDTYDKENPRDIPEDLDSNSFKTTNKLSDEDRDYIS